VLPRHRKLSGILDGADAVVGLEKVGRGGAWGKNLPSAACSFSWVVALTNWLFFFPELRLQVISTVAGFGVIS
jgi:hypothetical protein